jgi:LacI family transcriptional regulator
VFVSEVYPVSSVAERLNGFMRGLAQYGMNLLNDAAPGALSSGYTVEDFTRRLQEYLQHSPFSVFAENDVTAVKIMDVLQQHGLSAGDAVGLVGFDNTAICRHLAPPLTTIEQNGALVGETAAELAVHKIETGSKQSVRHILPTQLIARSSCGEKRPHDGKGGNASTG